MRIRYGEDEVTVAVREDAREHDVTRLDALFDSDLERGVGTKLTLA